MDLYQIWFRGSSRGRNQLCGILLQSAHGFRFCECVRGQNSPFSIELYLFSETRVLNPYLFPKNRQIFAQNTLDLVFFRPKMLNNGGAQE